MLMMTDDAGLEIVLPDECLRLLVDHSPNVGRVGLISDGRPLVLPVNYVMVDDAVVFRTGRGAKLAAATEGAAVAFEVDAIDASWEEGWSVVVHGRAEVVRDDDEIARLDRLPLRAWVPAERVHHVRIVPEQITGRSIEEGAYRRSEQPAWQGGT